MFRKIVSLLRVSMAVGSALLVLLLFQGCGGGGGSGSPTAGTLKLAITDKASNNYAQVVISIREIRAVPAGMENAQDNDPGLPVVVHYATPRVIDVMQLQFAQQALGEVALPAGNYSQLRLILDPAPANYLVLSGTTAQIPLKTPSGQQSGLKILGPIGIKPGIITAMMIDFDPNTAIVARGNGDYILKPTGIRLVQVPDTLTQFGSITGTVASPFTDWSSAVVSVKRRGAITDVDPIAAGRIFSNYTSGAWQAPFAAFVPPSSATVQYKTFIQANGFRLYSSPTVAVTQGQATDLGTVIMVRTP